MVKIGLEQSQARRFREVAVLLGPRRAHHRVMEQSSRFSPVARLVKEDTFIAANKSAGDGEVWSLVYNARSFGDDLVMHTSAVEKHPSLSAHTQCRHFTISCLF